jgi:uncharacterized protein (TIGR02265 family)
MNEPVFFASAFEGLYLRGLDGLLTPTVVSGLKARGLDLSQPLQAAYPYTVWSECMFFTANAVFPHLPEEDGVEAMGVAFMRGFTSTLIGSAVTQMAKLVGVERTLRRMHRNSRTTNNMYVSTAETLGPGHLVLETVLEPGFVGRVPMTTAPGARFQAGIVLGIFKFLERPAPRLTTRLVDAATQLTTIDVQWWDAERVAFSP